MKTEHAAGEQRPRAERDQHPRPTEHAADKPEWPDIIGSGGLAPSEHAADKAQTGPTFSTHPMAKDLAADKAREWTKWDDSLLSIRLPDGSRIECSSTEARDKVIETHNASITSERGVSRHWNYQLELRLQEIQQLREQLAETERKYLDMERKHIESERQLAAEQAAIKQHNEDQRRNMLPDFIDIDDTTALDAAIAEATKDLQHALTDTFNQREDAIAAAQQPLVDGLHRLYALRDPTCQVQAERAYETALRSLANAKEWK